jgi:hypothetical protein
MQQASLEGVVALSTSSGASLPSRHISRSMNPGFGRRRNASRRRDERTSALRSARDRSSMTLTVGMGAPSRRAITHSAARAWTTAPTAACRGTSFERTYAARDSGGASAVQPKWVA